ncbi:uracil-DNA glycosylase [Halocola ammonii]
MEVKIEPSWKEVLQDEFDKPYFSELRSFVRSEYKNGPCYPPAKQVFNAFDHCSFDDVKVVVVGQDPYHGPGQANGLCFSVKDDVRIPPSLKNIFKEIHSDLGKPIPETGDLTRWARQGVLLLNATLTVRHKSPGSHQKKGWEEFTHEVIKIVNEKKENVVFLLWGAFAQKKVEVIDESKHLILASPHPSPFSADRGFFGNRHFSKTNEYLKSVGKNPINW